MFINANQKASIKNYFFISTYSFSPAVCVDYITDNAEKDFKKVRTCIYPFIKIHFLSPYFDFHNSYCLGKNGAI